MEISNCKKGLCFIWKLFLSLVWFSACRPIPESGVFPIRLDKVSDGKIPFNKLFSSVELVPLSLEETSATKELSKMEVSDNQLFIQNGPRQVLVWNTDGSYSGALDMDSDITDFSLSDDERSLEVLSGSDVYEYALPGLYQTRHLYFSDTSVCLKTIARITAKMTQIDKAGETKELWTEKKLIMSGYAYGSEYVCAYDLDKNTYSVSDGLKGAVSESSVGLSRFFRCNGKTYSLYASDGRINRHSVFSGPQYIWDFGKDYAGGLFFKNAQMTPENVWLSFKKEDGLDYILVFNRKTGRHIIIRRIKGNLEFPLGVINDGINWVCCPSSELDRYVDKKVMDDRNAGILDSLVLHSGPVVIKYFLLGF